jgi:hypothetical protein
VRSPPKTDSRLRHQLPPFPQFSSSASLDTFIGLPGFIPEANDSFYPGGNPKMPFTYDMKKRIAEDKERGIVIRHIEEFTDDITFYSFRYESADISFRFTVTYYKEKRKLIERGQQTERYINVEVGILTPSVERGIKNGMAKAGIESLSPQRYQEIKNDLKEGMFVSEVPRFLDGTYIIPDFRVSFVDAPPIRQKMS